MINNLNGNREIMKRNSLLVFYDNTYNESYPSHWHNSMEIIMPVENGYTVVSNDIAYRLREGDILIIQPNVIHSMPAVPGRRFICQASLLPVYSLKMYQSLISLLPATLLLTPEKGGGLLTSVRQQLHFIYDEHKSISQTAELSMYIGTLQILLSISRACMQETPEIFGDRVINKNIQNSSFLSICDYISNHFEEKLTLEEMAQKSGYSKYHFERLFKKFTDQTFYQYLNDIRIKNAEFLIKVHDISITDAAYKSGFSNISAFIRLFKIRNNCTPSEFRNLNGAR